MQVGNLRKKVDDAMANYDQNLGRFRKDLEKMVPQIDGQVRELQEQMSEQPLGSTEAELEKVVEFIQRIRGKTNELKAEGKKINEY